MQEIILLVDDTLMIHRIVGQILKECGYRILKAENGQKGYEMAKTWKPDLIIMDVEMPVMDGIQATALIKADFSLSHIPLVILTSLGSEEDIQRAYAAGADGFLNKPISRDDLQATIRKLLDTTGAGGEECRT
ncbi:MAG: response regulator [Alphaproteobacteria bacterium]|uniref:Response regulator n=1 Tax=Candidatus Nitrobium versatile TaxID=2884831 RepID=A0A953M3C9_9BACT|nr:response regulator [Candidatus Nitrobium versatile]